MTAALAELPRDESAVRVLNAIATPWGFYIVAAVAAISLYILFVSPARRVLRSVGEMVGVAAAAGLIVWMAGVHANRIFSQSATTIGINPMFYIFGLLALAAAAKAMTDPRPLYCVLFFVLVALSVGAVLLMALVGLVVITAGAIMVLFVFVVMLAQKEGGQASQPDARPRSPLAALLLSFLLLAALGAAIGSWPSPIQELSVRELPPQSGQTADIGQELFSRNLLALEIAGVLLIMAIVGAIAVVRRRIVKVPNAKREMERTV
jgi:NADH-quinone oxidoreductase subunit J